MRLFKCVCVCVCQERCEWPIVGVCRFSILVRSSCLGCVCVIDTETVERKVGEGG